MLAPIDKVTRRGGNDIMQVVITRICDRQCSECTQLLPFRRDAREMTLDCIDAALASMAGWPGVVACFGGNPCTHSRFPEVCKLWEKHFPDQRQRGIWTNNLLKHGEQVRGTFWPHGRHNLNVHGDLAAKAEMERLLPGWKVFGEDRSQHGNQLLDYADFGIPESKWIEMRERCDINQNWSGAIYQGPDGTPVGYFCERAGSLDGVRGTCHGIPVVPGWWKNGMDVFQDQVRNCCNHFCGVPLRGKGYLDSEAKYGVSPSLVHLTDHRTGKPVEVEVVKRVGETTHELTDYVGLRK